MIMIHRFILRQLVDNIFFYKEGKLLSRIQEVTKQESEWEGEREKKGKRTTTKEGGGSKKVEGESC